MKGVRFSIAFKICLFIVYATKGMLNWLLDRYNAMDKTIVVLRNTGAFC